MVYIILLNYNGWKDTIECLESILKLDYHSFRIIVVDNQSTNNSLQFIHNWADGTNNVGEEINPLLPELVYPMHPKPIRYLHFDKQSDYNGFGRVEQLPSLITIQAGSNNGFAAGNNIGIKFALTQSDLQYVWLLNNDTVVPPDSLSRLVACSELNAQKEKKIGIIGSKLLYYHKPQVIQALGGKYNKWFALPKHIAENTSENTSPLKDVEHDYIVGASMFVNKEFLLDVGYLSEDYFLYFEELDWQQKGNRKGWSSSVCSESVVYHKEGASIGSGKGKLKSELSDLYSVKNRILFTKKFYPLCLPTVYIGFFGILLNRIKRGQFSRASKILRILIFNEINR